MADEPSYLTPKQVVERYGNRITTRTLSNWRSAKRGPQATKIGGRVIYPLKQLIEWEEKNTQKP